MAYKGTIIGNCGSERPYTKKGSCDIPESTINTLIITDLNANYPLDVDTFKTAFEGYFSVDGIQRMYPVKDLVGSANNGGEINAPELGTFGGPTPNGITAFNVVYQINAGSCMYKELSKLNGHDVRVFRVDKKKNIYGTVVTKNNVDYFSGFKAKVYAQEMPDSGDAAYVLNLAVYYSTDYESESQNKHGFNIGNVPDGLEGIKLIPGSVTATAKVVTSCGGMDITPMYTWTADMFVDSAGTNPTSVNTTTASGYITFSPNGAYKIANAEILDAGNVIGYEGVDEYVKLL